MNPNRWTPEEETEEFRKAFSKRALPIILFVLIGMESIIGIFFMLERHLTLKMVTKMLDLFSFLQNFMSKVREYMVTQKKTLGCFSLWFIIFGIVSIILILVLPSPEEEDYVHFGKC